MPAVENSVAGNDPEGPTPLTVLGRSRGGTYVLRIRVAADLELPFGGFRGGRVIPVKAGDHAYVGSARARTGALSLARRLVRHATRTGERPPQPIREPMIATLLALGLGDGDLRPRDGKRLKWNVDHLLDRPEAELTAALLLANGEDLEFAVADAIAADPEVVVFAPGLGAADHRGGTHLVRVEAADPDAWWRSLPHRLGLSPQGPAANQGPPSEPLAAVA